MKENYKKLTDDFKKDFVAKMEGTEFKDFFAKVKDATSEDSGTFDVVVSTADRDRQNEIVMQDGWDLSFYKLNPVVLWAHDYSALPIGTCTSIAVIDGKLTASGKFAPASANPMAQQVRMLYDLGMVKTVSVGFIPTEFDSNDRDVVTKAQVLEFSFVPVPANPYALSLRQIKELNLDVPFLMTKGLSFSIKEKDAQAGDTCQLDDGTPGILATDPKNSDGPMICIPAKAMGHKEALEHLNKSIEVFKADHVKAHKDHQENHTKALEVFKSAIHEAAKHLSDGDVNKSEKSVEVFKEAFDNHEKALGLENERHSKEMDTHCEKVGKAIEVFKESVKDHTDSHPEDAGGNPTADSVRMMHAVKDAFSHLTLAHTALKEYADSEGGKGGQPNHDDPNDQPDNQDNENSKAGTAEGSKSSTKDSVDEVNDFVKNREFLKAVSIALGQTLRKYNREDKASK